MRTWLLITLDASERLYRGHSGYDDQLRSVYRYDSFVPNHKQIAAGDAVVLRGKLATLGCAVIERLDVLPGSKTRSLCKECKSTKLKERKQRLPRYRCECGARSYLPFRRPELGYRQPGRGPVPESVVASTVPTQIHSAQRSP